MLFVIASLLIYIVYVLDISRKAPLPAKTPQREKLPIKCYGIVEPKGREVFLIAPLPRRIISIEVTEGDTVEKSQPIFILDNEIEKATVEVAKAKVDEANALLAINLEDLPRKVALFEKNVIPSREYQQFIRKVDYEKSAVKRAQLELELAIVNLDRLTVRSPIDGLVYKLDVRLGEMLFPEDSRKIIIGAKTMQIRLFLEAFWRDLIQERDIFVIYDSETGKFLGKGAVQTISLSMGRRDFRTEDAQERFDTKFNEIILSLPDDFHAPLGLSVRCERQY